MDRTRLQTIAAAAHSKQAVVFDVRSQAEWDSGHACEALHLPLDRLERGMVPDLPKETPIYIYCRSGNRSALARVYFMKHGFTQVTNIGGLADWHAAGGCVTA